MPVAIQTLLSLLFLISGAAYAAKPAAKFKSPRTEFGQPDLQGVWNYSSDVPLERPKEFADKEFFTREDIEKLKTAKVKQINQFANIGVGAHSTAFFDFEAQIENLRTSLITYPVDGHMPKLRDGVQHVGGTDAVFADIKGTHPVRFTVGGIGKDGPEDRGLFERCISVGSIPPYNPGVENNYIQISQSRGHVVILSEHIHDARVVPLDGRPFVLDQLRSWSGESRGHWEGDTLVVITKNFNDLMMSFNGSGTAYHKVVTERFIRTSANSLRYEATVEDPATFQDKIILSFPMAKSDARIFEFACHEGNYDLAVTLAGARKQELNATQAKQ
ncbi:MAG TPA: hypothetical protein VET48_14670 [Steroidobacteraceae bacterium]|nr:hypothetical protein [Steroidobacteraceae bacterium]